VSSVRAVKERETTVERVEEDTPKLRVSGVNDAAELDAEKRAETALDVQRDWQPDLSGVTLHDDALSRKAADEVDAAAFTHGNDIYLGNEYEAGTPQGNHVLAHELAHVEQDHGPDEIHRFPATSMTSGPVDWAGQTTNVFRPGEGVSGGVYILSSQAGEGDVEKAVVKPVFGMNGLMVEEHGEQLTFGDKAMAQLIGVSAPMSRVVKKGSAEFTQLLALCQSKEPPKPTELNSQTEGWKPLTAAESFVVMSEVPKGKSIRGFAEDAATDQNKFNDLYTALFDPDLIFDLGKMTAGDALMGNRDRLFGASNLGNIMITMQDGKAKAHAIDTGATFGSLDPKSVAEKGSASTSMQGGFSAMKKLLEEPVGERVEGVFVNVVKAMRANQPEGTEAGNAPADWIEAGWQRDRGEITKTFKAGWDEALRLVMEAFSTNEGRAKIKAMTDDGKGTDSEKNLQFEGLEINAQYLAGRNKGQTHEEAAKDPVGYAAYDGATKFKGSDLFVPRDEYQADAAARTGINGDAFSADLTHPESLLAPDKVTSVVGFGSAKEKSWDAANLAKVGPSVEAAKNELAGLGAKSRKQKGKKVEVPRNRQLAGTYVASSYLVAAGAPRAWAATYKLNEIAEWIALASQWSGLDAQKAKALLPVTRLAIERRQALQMEMLGYRTALQTASANVQKIRKYKAGKVVSTQLAAVGNAAGEISAKWLEQFDAKKPSALLQSLTAASQRVTPSEEVKGQPRKQLIGSRGRK
jgi:hypothetical protein